MRANEEEPTSAEKNGSPRRFLACLWAIGMVAQPAAARAEADAFGVGDGHEGDRIVSLAGTVVNGYAPLVAAVTAGDTTLQVEPPSVPFAAGDLALVWQVAGLSPAPDLGDQIPIDLVAGGVGRWELARVESVAAAGDVLTLRAPIVNPSGFAAGASQVVQVPEYTSVTVSDGASIVAAPWNGRSGGIAAFFATGAVTLVGKGAISASGAGFRGGVAANNGNPANGTAADDTCGLLSGSLVEGYAQRGEGLAGDFTAAPVPASVGGRGNLANGAGGGNCWNAGGGGGGNGGVGGMGGYSMYLYRTVGGLGGATVPFSPLERMLLGGGGGAGEMNNGVGSSGGPGGGVVFVRVGSLLGSNGKVSADGSGAATSINDGAGGGGAGGTVVLRVIGDARCENATARGGPGGSSTYPVSAAPGGGGAGGRAFLEVATGKCSAAAQRGVAGTQPNATLPGGVNFGATDGSAGVVEEHSPGRMCSDNGGCAAPQPRCWSPTAFNAGFCVECIDGVDCAASPTGSLCDTASHACVPCVADFGSGLPSACKDPNRPLCVGNGPLVGTCVQCTTADVSRCLGAMPICDAATQVCRGCVAGDCAGALPACAVSGPLAGNCVSCTEDAHCGGAVPHCDLSTNLCVACVDNGHCSGSTPICDKTTRACRACTAANAEEDCTSNGVCADVAGDPKLGQCVQCTATKPCASPMTCDSGSDICVGCTSSSQCSNPNPVCGSGQRCERCIGNADCASAGTGPVCHLSGSLQGACTPCTSDDASHCPSALPKCDSDRGQCVECLAGSDCQNPKTPACDSTALVCAACGGDQGSGRPRACDDAKRPRCATAGALAGACVECTRNDQCPGDAPTCAVDQGLCACAGDADCGGPASGRVCSTVGAGICQDGCRGTGGNGCPAGSRCTSNDGLLGSCVPVPDGGIPEDARPANDGGGAAPSLFACNCGAGAGSPLAAFAALALVGRATIAASRRRSSGSTRQGTALVGGDRCILRLPASSESAPPVGSTGAHSGSTSSSSP